jgi:hypothetical protein
METDRFFLMPGGNVMKRNIELTDNSGPGNSSNTITLTVWHDLATKWDAKENSVIIGRDAIINEYKGMLPQHLG